MKGTLLRRKDGTIESPVSAYQPPAAISELTEEVAGYHEQGTATLQHPMDEYNGLSITERANQSQRTWLAHPDAPYEGDDEWRWNGVRPITRNRVIFEAAQLTRQLLYPKSFAQNNAQEEDRDAAYAMDTLVEHNIRHSNYETAFLFGVISSLVNPINYFHVEYCESWQTAWQRGEQKRVLDDVFSGFQHSLVPIDEILFSNAYVYEWQMQDWIIRKRRVGYEEMQGKFGEHEYWPHVQEGKLCMAQDGFIYDVEDINDGMVGHVNFKHRRTDCELDFVNGVYLSNPNSDYNPFYHRTNKDMPEYDTVKFGFEPVDAMRFVGYKALVDKMENDQDATDRSWQDYFDASRMATFPPVITMGAGKLDKDVMAPSGVTEIGKEAKMEPVTISNPGAALGALREAERSGNESSLDPQAGGMQQGPQKTKAEVLTLEDNKDTTLGIPSKMIGVMVRDIGKLVVHDIVRHQTIGEAGELLGEMLYKTFTVDKRVREGHSKTTYVKFTDKYAGAPMSKEEKETKEYELMTEAGNEKELIEVNPAVFAYLDFYMYSDPDQVMRQGGAFEKNFKMAVYDKAMQNKQVLDDPQAQNKILRDFLFEPLMGGEASKYLPKIPAAMQGVIPGLSTGNPQGGGGRAAAGASAGGASI